MKVVEGAFIAIVAKNATPYRNDVTLPQNIREMEIPCIFMIDRIDGKIGFPGGTMETEEFAIETAIREVGEEIDCLFDEVELEHVCVTTYKDDRIDLTTHLFAAFIDAEEMDEISNSAICCDQWGSEVTGFKWVQCLDWKKGGYSEFLKHNFPHTAKEQLENLVEKYDLLKVEV